MENISEALFISCSVLIFVLAISITAVCLNSSGKLLKAVSMARDYRYEYSESADFAYVNDERGLVIE